MCDLSVLLSEMRTYIYIFLSQESLILAIFVVFRKRSNTYLRRYDKKDDEYALALRSVKALVV